MNQLFYAKITACLLLLSLLLVEADEYCGRKGKKEFYCDKGHCCGHFQCCNYYRYYEMWWFWLIWCLITILGCTCAYYRKRQGLYGYITACHVERQQVQVPFRGAPKYKLPSYAEVIAMPSLGPPDDQDGAPPPYVLTSLPSTSAADEENNNGLSIVPETNLAGVVDSDDEMPQARSLHPELVIRNKQESEETLAAKT